MGLRRTGSRSSSRTLSPRDSKPDFVVSNGWRRGWDSSQVATSAEGASCAMPYKPARDDNDRTRVREMAERVGFDPTGFFRFCKLQIPRYQDCWRCHCCRAALHAVARTEEVAAFAAVFRTGRILNDTHPLSVRTEHLRERRCCDPTRAGGSSPQARSTTAPSSAHWSRSSRGKSASVA